MSIKEAAEWAENTLFVDLSDDGDTEEVVFVGDPRVIETQSQYGTRLRAFWPVMTADGLRLWGTNRRQTRKVARVYDSIAGNVVRIVRVGASGSPSTSYVLQEAKGDKALLKAADAVTADDIEKLFTDLEARSSRPSQGLPGISI